MRTAPCVRKAGGGVVDCLLGQTKCKQMCCVIKRMQGSSSPFCRRPPNHGNTPGGDLLFLSPAKNTHQPAHVHKTHTHPRSPETHFLDKALLFQPGFTQQGRLLSQLSLWTNKYTSSRDFTGLTVETTKLQRSPTFSSSKLSCEQTKRQRACVLVWDIGNFMNHFLF